MARVTSILKKLLLVTKKSKDYFMAHGNFYKIQILLFIPQILSFINEKLGEIYFSGYVSPYVIALIFC